MTNSAPTRVRWLIFGLACLASFINYVHRYSWGVAKPYLRDEYQLSDLDLGWLDSAFSLTYAFGQFPGGLAGDIFGHGGGKALADELGVPLLSEIPLDAAVVSGGDSGSPVIANRGSGPAAEALSQAVDRLVEIVPPAQLETCTGRIPKLLADLEEGAA